MSFFKVYKPLSEEEMLWSGHRRGLKNSMSNLYFLYLSIYVIFLFRRMSSAADVIVPPQSLSDGETLVSKEGSFELGFFSPGTSRYRYLGIWYKNIPVRTVVWVANRESPIDDSSGVLKISASGQLVLLDGSKGNVVWSSSSSAKTVRGPVAQLLESGNFILRYANESIPENYFWQSFDYPSDTFLQGMKLGWDSINGLNRHISSWKSANDPAPGDLIYQMSHNNYPEAFVWKGSAKFYRTGPWNGIRFSGAPEFKPNPVYDYKFVISPEEVYYMYKLKNKSFNSMIVLNQTTYSRQRMIWVQAHLAWEVYSTVPRDYCDNYGLCGANSVCVYSESPVCQCLKGFKPQSPERWSLMDWSQGCVRSKPLACQKEVGFVKFDWLKLPETTYTWANISMNLKDCRAKCKANCSCTAYTNWDIRGKGSGCVLWFGDLIDIRQSAGGQELYVRMQNSELGMIKSLKMKRALLTCASIAIVFGVLVTSYYIWKWRSTLNERANSMDPNNSGENEDPELPHFSCATLVQATSNFSASNKLGEGGFGPVYKGILVGGQQIAVKRLSMNSKQGLIELKNEVTLIAKLQHRNLVKLLGCCIQEEEMMLIYEYMSNKSLDFFIFDDLRGKLLEWSTRFKIICGIARGLLYLHEDSRLRIIHRDLKASNVLLDNELTPKISDFGLARSFGSDETAAKTIRVVGTYGYMSPEYAVDGLFSTKSDVFSFGVLLLEIITGKKNRGFRHPSHNFNLIGHTWRLWKGGVPLELIDRLYEEYCRAEVLRCIHIGLLCVQQSPEDRPKMSSVVLMLVSEIPMPEPKQPGFYIDRNPFEEADSCSSKNKSVSDNKISISMLEAR